MTALRWTVIALLAIAALLGTTLTLARRSWRTAIESLDREVGAPGAPTSELDVEVLPPIVARYLARSVPDAARSTRAARLRQRGTFQMGEGEEGWRSFEAIEVFRVHPPAFYWDARIAVAPGVHAYVRDSYHDGTAGMVGKVAGLLTVVNEPSSPQLESGALARYLAEAVWFPTRLAVGPGLRWTAIDDVRAVATLTDANASVSLTFTFDEDGDPVRVDGDRARATDEGFVTSAWVGTFSDHGEVAGVRIPRYGEVGWVVDGVWVPYWRGRIESAAYDPP